MIGWIIAILVFLVYGLMVIAGIILEKHDGIIVEEDFADLGMVDDGHF